MLAKSALAVAVLLFAGSATAAMAQQRYDRPNPFYPQGQYPALHSRHHHVIRPPVWTTPAERHYRTMPLDRDIYPGLRDR
jgi:hypothetical protein